MPSGVPIHPELRPERLAWACAQTARITAHRRRLEKLSLPVPLCLMSTYNVTKDKRRQILAARDQILEFGKYAYEKRIRNERQMKDYFDRQTEKMRDVAKDLPLVQEMARSTPEASLEELESLDGEREGEKNKHQEKPSDHRIDYEVLPSFVEFAEDLSDTCWALIGPAGGGKSVAAIMKMLAHCSLHPTGARYVIIRNTYRMLHDTTIPTFFDPRMGVPRALGKWDAAQEKFTLGGKYEFYFRSCERPEDVDKFKGMEITGYFINEAMEVKEEVKNLLDQRIGRFPKEPYRDEHGILRYRGTDKTLSILDSNPPDTEHWLHERFKKNPLANHKYVLQPPYENAHNLPKGYYDRMRERYRDAPDLIARYIEGKWGAVYRGKAVYPEFDHRSHVASQPLKSHEGLPMMMGFDFGLTPACVWTQVRPNGTWAILAEMWADNMAADEFGDAVLRYTRTFFPNASEYMWFADPSGFKKSETDAKSVADILSKKGIGVIAGAITLTARLEAVRKRLRLRNGMLVSPTCTRLIDGFAGAYCYKEIVSTNSMGQKFFSDKPEKNKWSHIHDALQYVASGMFAEQDRALEDKMLEMFAYKPVTSSVGW